MNSHVTVITGAPGTGKSTTCDLLAGEQEGGVHIRGDDFYEYISDLIPPTDPASGAQNTAVITATARAARAYSEAGYNVYLDGIFGPWFVPVLLSELAVFHYIILTLPVAETVGRGTSRVHKPVTPDVVEQMHNSFQRDQSWSGHMIDITSQSPGQVADRIRAAVSSCSHQVSADKSTPLG